MNTEFILRLLLVPGLMQLNQEGVNVNQPNPELLVVQRLENERLQDDISSNEDDDSEEEIDAPQDEQDDGDVDFMRCIYRNAQGQLFFTRPLNSVPLEELIERVRIQ